MGLTIDFSDYDQLPAKARYDAVGKLIDEAKALVAAERAHIAHDLATDIGTSAAAQTLGISATRVYGLTARHRQTHAPQITYMDWADANDGSERRLVGYVREVLETSGLDPAGFDLEAIRAEYRDAIQVELPEGVTFTGAAFVGPAPAADGVREEIRAAVARVDLWGIIACHDPDIATA